jgi:hypothetical protein
MLYFWHDGSTVREVEAFWDSRSWKIVIIRQGREDIFLSRGSLFPEKRSFEGNKEARLKIVFSSVVYILFFSLLDPLKPFLIIIIN